MSPWLAVERGLHQNFSAMTQIPLDEIELTAVRAQGAGGQNVNKVSSAIHLRFDIRASSLPPAHQERLLRLNDSRITGGVHDMTDIAFSAHAAAAIDAAAPGALKHFTEAGFRFDAGQATARRPAQKR